MSIGMASCNLGVEGAKVVAEMGAVSQSLTSIDLSSNKLAGETSYVKATQVQGTSFEVGDKVTYEGREMTVSKGKDSDGEIKMIDLSGVRALADSLAVRGSLTHCDVRHNNISGNGATQLSAAVLANSKIEVFNEIPIKEMRADSLTTLDLSGKGIGVEGGMVVAGLVPVAGSLTVADLRYNELDTESARTLATVAKE